MVTKKYFTWIEQVGANGHRIHIKPQMDNNWHSSFASVEETPYGKTPMDARRLGIINYNATKMTKVTSRGDKLLDRLKGETVNWGLHLVTPQEALDLCNEWYPPAEGDSDYFSLDADGFTLIDNRPEDVL